MKAKKTSARRLLLAAVGIAIGEGLSPSFALNANLVVCLLRVENDFCEESETLNGENAEWITCRWCRGTASRPSEVCPPAEQSQAICQVIRRVQGLLA